MCLMLRELLQRPKSYGLSNSSWSHCSTNSVLFSAFHLHDTSEESHRRGHQHPLFICGKAFKSCNVNRRTVIWDQPGDHWANHQTQDRKWTCEGWDFNCTLLRGHLRSTVTICESLTYWDVSGCAEEKIYYDREKCGEESIPGRQRSQQTVSQTCNTE